MAQTMRVHRVYLGGGNQTKINPAVVAKLKKDADVVNALVA
jgi:hypothetical protein